jgi:hypothetical protein
LYRVSGQSVYETAVMRGGNSMKRKNTEKLEQKGREEDEDVE